MEEEKKAQQRACHSHGVSPAAFKIRIVFPWMRRAQQKAEEPIPKSHDLCTIYHICCLLRKSGRTKAAFSWQLSQQLYILFQRKRFRVGTGIAATKNGCCRRSVVIKLQAIDSFTIGWDVMIPQRRFSGPKVETQIAIESVRVHSQNGTQYPSYSNILQRS